MQVEGVALEEAKGGFAALEEDAGATSLDDDGNGATPASLQDDGWPLFPTSLEDDAGATSLDDASLPVSAACSMAAISSSGGSVS